MKKITKSIISALLLTVMGTAAVGCATGNQTYDDINTKLLFDFENESVLDGFTFLHQTGERKITNEKEVASGKALLVNIQPTGTIANLPTIGFSVSSSGITDVKTVDYIGVDVYNAENRDLFVGMRLLDGVNKTLHSEVKYVSPQALGKLRFVITDTQNKANASNIQFFVYTDGLQTAGAKCYIDNITATSDSGVTAPKTLRYGEILSFADYADIEHVSVSNGGTLPVTAKSYEKGSLCLNFLGRIGYLDKTLEDVTVEEQKVTLSVDETLLDKIDFSGIRNVYADVCNESSVERKVIIWYESGEKRTSKTYTLSAGAWQTLSIKTEGKTVDKMGFSFDSADILQSEKMLIRSIRYTL